MWPLSRSAPSSCERGARSSSGATPIKRRKAKSAREVRGLSRRVIPRAASCSRNAVPGFATAKRTSRWRDASTSA